MLCTLRRQKLQPSALIRCLLHPKLRHLSDSSAGHHLDYTCIKVGVDQDVGTITISRPKQLNALNTQVRAVLAKECPHTGVCLQRHDRTLPLTGMMLNRQDVHL